MTTIHPLETIFGQVNGNAIISIDTETELRLLGGRKNPHIGHAMKIGLRHNVMVFQNKTINAYDAMVRRRLEKEGKNPDRFQLSPRTWGERVQGMPFVVHKDQMYLEVIFLKAGETFYTLHGEPTLPAFIQGLNEEHDEAEQGGLDNKVIIRTFKFSSILAVRINGEDHYVRS